MNTNALNTFLAENVKFLLGLFAALLAVVAIWAVWNQVSESKNREAVNALYEVQQSTRPLLNEKKYDQAVNAFDPILKKYAGTRVAFETTLQIGDIWMDAGKYPEAANQYEQAAKSAKDTFSRVLSFYNLGIAQESAGKYQEAIASYDKAIQEKGSDFLRPEVMMAQARCYEALNQAPKAVEIYKNIEEKFSTKTYYSGAASAFEKQLRAKM